LCVKIQSHIEESPNCSRNHSLQPKARGEEKAHFYKNVLSAYSKYCEEDNLQTRHCNGWRCGSRMVPNCHSICKQWLSVRHSFH
jgi:hypothetical protein